MSVCNSELHASGQYYMCGECEAHFETKGSLKDHKKCHQEPEHLCHLCSDKFRNVHALQVCYISYVTISLWAHTNF